MIDKSRIDLLPLQLFNFTLSTFIKIGPKMEARFMDDILFSDSNSATLNAQLQKNSIEFKNFDSWRSWLRNICIEKEEKRSEK